MGSAPAHHLGTITMKFLLLLLQSPLCALRLTQLSATPPATTFPTLSGLRSPTPRPRPLSSPTPTLLLSTPPLQDARTRPVPWCLVLTVVLFPSESQLLLLLQLLRSLLWRRPGRRGKLRPSRSRSRSRGRGL